jgi:hypothetical protein
VTGLEPCAEYRFMVKAINGNNRTSVEATTIASAAYASKLFLNRL